MFSVTVRLNTKTSGP